MNVLLVEDVEQVQEVNDLHLACSLVLHLVLLQGLDNQPLESLDALDWIV